MKLLLSASLLAVFLASFASPRALALKVPLSVSHAVWEGMPVTSGVPLPAGSVVDPNALRLYGPDGTPVPLQTRTLSKWPDGSIRWILLDFQTGAQDTSGAWTLSDAPSPNAPGILHPIRVEETEGEIRLDTGPLQFSISKLRFTGVEDVTVDGRQIIPPGHGGGTFLDMGEGRIDVSRLRPAQVFVEEAGPLRTVVRASASYTSPDGVLFDFILRVHAYAGKRFVRLDHTFVNRSDKVIRLRELTIEYPLAGHVDRYVLGGDRDVVFEGALDAMGVQLVQSPDHQFGLPETHAFQILREGEVLAGGLRSEGWMKLSGKEADVTVAVRDFWELYPKGLRAGKNHFAVDLWPKGALPRQAGQMDINAGAAKAHQILLKFAPRPTSVEEAQAFVEWLDRPPMAFATPEWYASTGAAAKGALSPAVADGTVVHPEYEKWVDWMVREKYLDKRELRDEYGMMHFGDYLVGGTLWNSLQYDLPRGFMQQFFRTGDRWFFDRAAEMVRNQQDALIMWNLDISKGQRPHRRYGGNPWSGEPHGLADTGEPQQFIGGMVDHYLLTGDWRTLEAILFMADGIANVRGVELNWFRYGNWRAAGYPLTILADAYTLTRDEKYRQAAVRILQECVLPRRHTLEHGFSEAVADGVWWYEVDRGYFWSTNPNAQRWTIQAWQIDPMADGLYSVYEILDDGPVKEDVRAAFLAVADFALERAWNAERGGWNVWVSKDNSGRYTSSGLYGGFMSMLGVSTMARAYELTGDLRYLEAGKEMFFKAISDRIGVVEAKQVGQSLQYAPIFLKTWDETRGIEGIR